MNPKLFFRIALPVGAFALIAASCAKLQDQLPVQPSVGVHPNGWADSTSPNFHRTYLFAHNMPLDSCRACHGQDLRGGSARSCAGGGCHNTSKYLFHPDAWTDTASALFHGSYLRNSGFVFVVMDTCAVCHGRDFTGGQANTSCSNSGCHLAADGGPIACYNCHGDRNAKTFNPPRALNGSTDTAYVGVGQHRGHLYDTTLSVHVYQKCAVCHAVPDSFWQPSHITNATLVATITIGDSLAFKRTNVPGGYKYSDTIPTTAPNPRWDAASMTCQNVYCHGNFKNGNVNNAPKWTAEEQDACGTCHGDPVTHNPLPGGTHPKNQTDCGLCHYDFDDNNNVTDRSKHIDGKLNISGTDYDTW